MRNPPAEVIATWPKPNYVNPVTRGPTLVIVELILLPLALICVVLRLYVRYALVKRAWWDDWMMVLSAIFTIGVTVCVILGDQKYGWNKHVWDLTVTEMSKGRQISISSQTFFLVASGFSKLSILLSYLRIAPAKSRFGRLTYVVIGLVSFGMGAFLIALWTECRPMSAYWDLELSERHCIAEGPAVMAQSISTLVADVVIYILPMPVLYKLKLPTLQRIGLMMLFGLGGVSCIGAGMRTYWTYNVTYVTYDVTWEGFQLWIWTAVEVNTAVICGCIPSIRPLIFPKKGFSSSHGTTSNSHLHPSNRGVFNGEMNNLKTTVALGQQGFNGRAPPNAPHMQNNNYPHMNNGYSPRNSTERNTSLSPSKASSEGNLALLKV